MKIEWVGHASFIITSNDGTKILTDPYESGGFAGTLHYSPIKGQVDIITVSHAHPDHCHIPASTNKDTLIIREKTNATVKGIAIRSVDSFHDASGGKKRGINSIFVFEVDGMKIAHFGDLGHVLDDNQIKELGKVDIAMIPVGGNFTINAQEASDLVKQIKPKIVIPMHFKTSKVEFDIDGVDVFLQGKKDVEELKTYEIEIKPEMLSSSSAKIIVLHSSH
jgi:L-ascorbate metabolism protein UlaG (beta-lactamase superfamily)